MKITCDKCGMEHNYDPIMTNKITLDVSVCPACGTWTWVNNPTEAWRNLERIGFNEKED